MSAWTVDEVTRALSETSPEAERMVARAARVVSAPRQGALTTSQLLLLLEALGGEGGEVQALAESLADRALREQRLRHQGPPGPMVA